MAYSDVILAQSGLKAYWRCDEASGNLVDEVAGKTATPHGTPTYSATGALTGSGDSNTAVNCDASGDYFDVADHADFALGNGPFTYECWAKRNSTPATFCQMIAKDTQGEMHFGAAGDKITTSCSTGQFIVRESGTTTDSNWHHVVWVHAASGTGNNKIYKDGVDVTVDGAQIGAVCVSVAPELLTLGAGSGGSGASPLLGHLDEVAIYNVALSAADVLAHYTAGTTPSITGMAFQADAFQNGAFQDAQLRPDLVTKSQAVHRAGVW